MSFRSPADLQKTFALNQINKLYCAQSHLHERLGEITDQANFSDLHLAIREAVNDMEQQITNTNKLYSAYKCEYSFELCKSLLLTMEEDFDAVQKHSGDSLRDMCLINYIQSIQNIISAAFQLLQLGFKKLETHFGIIIQRNYSEILYGQRLKLLVVSRIQAD